MSGSSVITYKSAIIATNLDMSVVATSSAMDLQGCNNYSIQAVFTGSPVGTLKLQISDDLVLAGPDSNVGANVINWGDYTGSQQAISSAGNWMWKIDAGGERWVQLVYTPTSGSGSLSATFSGKS